MNTKNNGSAKLFTPVLISGCIILMAGFSIRASFGVFQIPIADQFGWMRSEFSMAIAIQNLAWGVGQPIFAAIAEKIGDRKAIFIGAVVYALGLILSSFAVTPEAHQFFEILVGFGIAGTGFGVIIAAVRRSTPATNTDLWRWVLRRQLDHPVKLLDHRLLTICCNRCRGRLFLSSLPA